MKKLIFIFLGVLLLANSVQAKSFSKELKAGDYGDDVKNLQVILGTDPSIYPQKVVSGYFGSLTVEAIKKLQTKYGLTVTGILDKPTQEIIFPSNISLNVISPNGGESWKKNETYSISWSASVVPWNYNSPNGGRMYDNSSENYTNSNSFFQYVSLDLVKDSDPSYIHHIGSVNFYQAQYQWKIPNSIPEARDYRLRVSIGPKLPYNNFLASDTSNNPFSILGGGSVSPDAVEKLREQIRQMESVLNQLQAQLNAMKAILANL